MELWEHQRHILDTNPARYGLFWAPGLGKSLGLTELVRKNAFSVLCLSPKSLVPKWEQELESIGIECQVLSPYWFKKYHKELPYFDALIIDEADQAYAGSNQTSKALFAYLKKHNPPYIWLATATPYRSTPLNVYNLGRILGYMPMSYPEFREKFFFQQYFGSQPVWTPKMKHKDPAVKAQTQRDLHEYMSNFADIVRMEDVFDVPEQIFSVEPIAMTPQQEKLLKNLDEVAENRATFFRYQNEIENGWLDAKALGEDMTFPSEKVDRVLELCDQVDTAIVFSLYREQQQAIYQALKKKFPKAFVALVNGDNSSDAKTLSEELEAIAEGTHPKYMEGYLVASVKVAAGWEAKSVPLAVYASLPWSYQEWVQSQGRILRSNKLKSNVYRVLLGGSVDRRIWENLCDGVTYDPVKHAEELYPGQVAA